MSNYFPNAIYKNSKVLQVIKIRVDIPMNESQDNFIFETSYPELIYLGLNKEALLKELGTTNGRTSYYQLLKESLKIQTI